MVVGGVSVHTRLTVAVETPERAATSAIVAPM